MPKLISLPTVNQRKTIHTCFRPDEFNASSDECVCHCCMIYSAHTNRSRAGHCAETLPAGSRCPYQPGITEVTMPRGGQLVAEADKIQKKIMRTSRCVLSRIPMQSGYLNYTPRMNKRNMCWLGNSPTNGYLWHCRRCVRIKTVEGLLLQNRGNLFLQRFPLIISPR